MSDNDNKPGRPDLRVIRDELENAPPVGGPDAPDDPPPPPPPQDGPKRDTRGRFGDLERTPGEIYPGCPVKALGVSGKACYYLDYLKRVFDLSNHTKNDISLIFGGREDLLIDWFPAYGKDAKQPNGWKQDHARAAMISACREMGVWDPFERVRDVGAWPDSDGGAILNCGDAVWYRGQWRQTGELDGYIYPSAPPVPRPILPNDPEAPPREAGSVGHDVLETLETWRWLRPDIDPYLAFGWTCAAQLGGALGWRPMIWISGDKGTGKSTLQELLKSLMGGSSAVLATSNTTEAGLRQYLGHRSIPVELDEMEPDSRSDRIKHIIHLARQAASGGLALRGGADHKGQTFVVRSCFMFSSILVPPMLDQDISRMALLSLLPLERGQTAPNPNPEHWMKIGQLLRGRMLDQWHRLHETLERYRAALSGVGHSARSCDQFGTLLAMADLGLYDDVPEVETCEAWAEKLRAEVIQEASDERSDWERMLWHLLTQPLDVFRSGERKTVNTWIREAARLIDSDTTAETADRALGNIGLRVLGRGEEAQLAVANVNTGLADLFRDTHWYASGGQTGTWSQSAARIPGARKGNTRFLMMGSRCTIFPLRSIPEFLASDDASQGDSPATLSHPDPIET